SIGGISSDMVSETGFPVFSDSIATSSSAFSSIASASLRSARCRSLGVDHRHFSKARPAAWNAWSTSRASEFGAEAYTSPVDGLMMSIIAPDADAWTSPSMMLWKTFFSDMPPPGLRADAERIPSRCRIQAIPRRAHGRQPGRPHFSARSDGAGRGGPEGGYMAQGSSGAENEPE